MTTLSDILRDSPTSDPYEPWATALLSMCKGLQAEFLDERSLDEDVLEPLKAYFGERLTLHTVFDILHDSDESCSVHVLCDSQKPVVLARCVGDRSRYDDDVHVLDASFVKELMNFLIKFKADQQRAQLEERVHAVPDALARMKNVRYLNWVTDASFTVESPRWALVFPELFDKYAAHILQEEELVPLAKFQGWSRQNCSSFEEGANQVAVKPFHGESLLVDARQIVFSLLDSPEERSAVHQAIAAPDSWFAARWHQRTVCLLTVLQHRQGNAVPEQCCIGFDSPASAEAFIAEFAATRQGDFMQDMATHMQSRPGVIRWDVTVERAERRAAT
jgi:hypothetical protein